MDRSKGGEEEEEGVKEGLWDSTSPIWKRKRNLTSRPIFFHPVERAGRARCKKHSMRKRWNEGHRRRLSDLPPSAESSF